MYRASSLINKHGMHIVYYYLCMSFIMYCPEVIVHCFVLLQKRVIRLLCGAERLDHTNLLFHNVHILKITRFSQAKNCYYYVSGMSLYVTNECTAVVQNT